jgi:hypothetical protein
LSLVASLFPLLSWSLFSSLVSFSLVSPLFSRLPSLCSLLYLISSLFSEVPSNLLCIVPSLTDGPRRDRFTPGSTLALRRDRETVTVLLMCAFSRSGRPRGNPQNGAFVGSFLKSGRPRGPGAGQTSKCTPKKPARLLQVPSLSPRG